jgi:alpha-tubulin suppressor-like RCC1 family protein
VVESAVAVYAGDFHACALLLSGDIKCWGGNGSGQVGNGSTTNALSPVPVAVGAKVTMLAVGGTNTCVLSESGGVRCWGANYRNQLGDVQELMRLSPPATDYTTGAEAVFVGFGPTCIRKPGNEMMCTDNSAFLAAAFGSGSSPHSCTLSAAGEVQCWGRNQNGQLGDGTHNTWNTLRTTVYRNAKTFSVGAAHTCALSHSGRLRCWGANWFGQLGDGSLFDKASPTAVNLGVCPL